MRFNNNYAIATGIFSGLLFGIATPLSKLMLSGLNSFQLAGLLYLGAGIAMLPFVLVKKENIKLLFKHGTLLKTLGIVLFGGILGPLLLLAGLRAANAASVSIWLNMELVATAILGAVLFRESQDKYTWIGVVVTFAAGVITSFGEGLSGLTSGLLITAACFCWGMDNHLTAMNKEVSPMAVTFIKGISAGSVNFIIGSIITGQPLFADIVISALITGAFSYGLSIVLYIVSAQRIGATRSQILFSTAPLWGVLLSYMFFKGSFMWFHMASIVLLAFAVYFTNSSCKRQRRKNQKLI